MPPVQTLTLNQQSQVKSEILGPQLLHERGGTHFEIRPRAERTRFKWSIETSFLQRQDAEELYGFLTYHYRNGLSFWYGGADRGDIQNPILIGFGDGTRTDWLLPNDNITAASETIYLDAVEETGLTFTDASGLIEFNTAPSNNVKITAKYQCQFRCFLSEPATLGDITRESVAVYQVRFTIQENPNVA